MKKILRYISKELNFLHAKLVSKGNIIILNSWIDLRFGHIKKRNFGDDLNFYLLKQLSHSYVINIHNIYKGFRYTNYEIIGSLIEDFTNSNTIIWGAGAIKGNNCRISAKPHEVCAVRGKLTRQYLLDQGIECPEIFGDPALLLPFVYQPKIKRKNKVGLIPHISDINNPLVSELLNSQDIQLIRFDKYDNWHDIIDQICSCEFIISSSLHGLIISDAYSIPNLWIQFEDHLIGGTFKFRDYFSAVGRPQENPIPITTATTIESLISNSNVNSHINFDPIPLIKACPFQIKERIKKQIYESSNTVNK